MKVILSINSDIGKHGKIGMRTYMVAKECFEKNYLEKIFCRGVFVKDIPKKYFFIPPLQRLLSLTTRLINLRFASLDTQVKLQNKVFGIFDFWVRNHMPACNIFHTWDLLTGAMEKTKKQGGINILDIHMAPVEYRDEKTTPYEKADYLKRRDLIDYFIAPSEFTRDALVKLGVEVNKIFLVPFGVDIKLFYPVPKKKKKFVCMFAGTLSKRKGVHHLLRAWKELNLPNAELVLCGRTTRNFADLLHTYLKERKDIIIKGQVSGKELLNEYQRASVFAFPSLVEGSAKVNYEAMACGLPVITTYNAGPIAKDGESGFIIPEEDAEMLKKKIEYFYNHPEEIERMGKNARKEVEKYTWEIYGKNIVSVYEKIYQTHTH